MTLKGNCNRDASAQLDLEHALGKRQFCHQQSLGESSFMHPHRVKKACNLEEFTGRHKAEALRRTLGQLNQRD